MTPIIENIKLKIAGIEKNMNIQEFFLNTVLSRHTSLIYLVNARISKQFSLLKLFEMLLIRSSSPKMPTHA